MAQPFADALDADAFDAVIFDLDGVITDTARRHFEAWKATFDDFLAARSPDGHRPFTLDDYRRYVDGKPRYDGVRSFLQSRGIVLPDGSPGDSPDAETVCGVGNRKNARFRELIETHGVDAFPDAVDFVKTLLARGLKTAIVTSSKNGGPVLDAAGLSAMFETRVDGIVAAALGLAGKPAPDLFLEAARRLGVEARRTVVAEDAVAGVEAGRNGNFGCVIGVARDGSGSALAEAGADCVIHSFEELIRGR